jgi:hypothetical protein
MAHADSRDRNILTSLTQSVILQDPGSWLELFLIERKLRLSTRINNIFLLAP